MKLRDWLERQAPDFLATFQRFPLAILLVGLTTLIVIGAINDVVWLRDEIWARAALGLATGALCAVAGVYFRESRPESRLLGPLLSWLLPLVAVGMFQVTEISWLTPWALPLIALLWLSVSGFTRVERGALRQENQDCFWWVNHQAVTTAVIGAVGFLIIALGLFAIERSLSVLFGLSTHELFYEWVLPFAGVFLTPVYWLSTLPRLGAFAADTLRRPEFLSRAVGFLGQFVLVPLLLIYSLILLAYTAQIVITQQLPEGMIGWMVLGFVTIGAATWLVLHPPFMRDRSLVRFFRRWWFWLTLVPLCLFFLAVYVRIEAYGFTDQRLLLIAGGSWAATLSVTFLVGRGDIRLIPALAAAILLILSVGPWNYTNLPLQQQLARLDAVVANAGADPSASPPRADWSRDDVAVARGSIEYLAQTPEGRSGLRELFGRYGITWPADRDSVHAIFEALGQDMPTDPLAGRYFGAQRDLATPVDVSATPYLLGPISLYGTITQEAPPLRLWIEAGGLRVGPVGTPDLEMPLLVDLSPWLARQTGTVLVDPWLDFTIAERDYRLVVQSITIDRGEDGDGAPVLTMLDGQLFSAKP